MCTPAAPICKGCAARVRPSLFVHSLGLQLPRHRLVLFGHASARTTWAYVCCSVDHTAVWTTGVECDAERMQIVEGGGAAGCCASFWIFSPSFARPQLPRCSHTRSTTVSSPHRAGPQPPPTQHRGFRQAQDGLAAHNKCHHDRVRASAGRLRGAKRACSAAFSPHPLGTFFPVHSRSQACTSQQRTHHTRLLLPVQPVRFPH